MKVVQKLVLMTVAGLPVPLVAHHSIEAAFDTATLVAMSGTIAQVQIVNPHVLATLDVVKADGQRESWEIEMGAPHALARRGIEIKELLFVGRPVTVETFVDKQGERRATVRALITAQGERFEPGDSFGWTLITPAAVPR